MIPMNMFKKNGGFTLVELIVVIAILAILAGIAIPAYSGYITEANKSSDDAQLVVVEQAIGAACALNGKTAAEATVTMSTAGVTAVAIGDDDITDDFESFYAGNTLNLKYYTSVAFTAGEFVTTPAAE